MSVNRNANKIYNCKKIRKEEPDNILEEFEVRALNPGRALQQLNKRFFLEDDEEWNIERVLKQEVEEKEPWRVRRAPGETI